jgi:transcriptional regulator with XRE-family HTH domain
MILSVQIRAARTLLGWTAQNLASASNVGVATIRRLEVQDGVPDCHPRTLQDLRRAFEEAGIEFIGTPQNGAGVRFKPTEKGSQV